MNLGNTAAATKQSDPMKVTGTRLTDRANIT